MHLDRCLSFFAATAPRTPHLAQMFAACPRSLERRHLLLDACPSPSVCGLSPKGRLIGDWACLRTGIGSLSQSLGMQVIPFLTRKSGARLYGLPVEFPSTNRISRNSPRFS